jgi:sucrose-6-phosphate hydrolase SacC (GH32 family)
MAANVVENLVTPEAMWEHRTGIGWCSNWDYSQRNPESFMSVLSEADFRFIELFFREVT